MRLRRSRGFHGLKRPTLRQTWNKYNLYNLSQFRSPVRTPEGLFKQKWVSKGATRRYHGEPLGETKWTRLFRPTVRAVISMDHKQLAADDGRMHSAGRGLGTEKAPQAGFAKGDGTEGAPRGRAPGHKPPAQPIPYANMTFAALERRLETAVFRAMFASSTRQARQFCIHGAVKVNGKKMVYPGYNLNPGDLFQVEPERVMFATGATKDRIQRRQGRLRKRETPEPSASEKRAKADLDDGPDAVNASDETALDSRGTLQELLATSQTLATSEKDVSPAKRKRALRSFTKLVRKTLSQTGKDRAPSTSSTDQLRELMTTLNISVEDKAPARPGPSSETSASSNSTSSRGPVRPTVSLAQTQTVRSHQQRQLQMALQEARENPFDPAKPYATPWRPRPFMSAFACVPRYLEVHPSICAAVYLRHPVARPGLAEVPTPFDGEMMALAHNWYLRRR